MQRKRRLTLAKAKKLHKPVVKRNTEELKSLLSKIDKLRQAVESIDTDVNLDLSTFTNEIRSLVEAVNKNLADSKTDQTQTLAEVVKKIESIKLSPELKPVFNPVVKQLSQDIYLIYKLARSDTRDEELQYHGYVKSDGKWFITKIKGDELIEYTYAKGGNDFETNWELRQRLTYVGYDEAGF